MRCFRQNRWTCLPTTRTVSFSTNGMVADCLRIRNRTMAAAFVSPQIAGIFHQHWINLRMDFDIDGTVNAVEECNTKLLPYDLGTNPRGRAFTVARTVFGKEKQAERNLNLSTNRTWIV